jgi:hypothetical protein
MNFISNRKTRSSHNVVTLFVSDAYVIVTLCVSGVYILYRSNSNKGGAT